ncbi:hypothetical protein [Paracoccus sp. SCSIO 75233]|uniref:hypothetical protein n=1 Tax=Paracoccus sp. SCSIO 75233 TaxID=3017782 RepID=UPI0022F0FC09|nr:hypothetical protein [Paracoccus sp. SCSIO 75233]WBU55081.1 hypothetical protein PAF12_17460 [Paracoccus sp. SCSIO 75233]
MQCRFCHSFPQEQKACDARAIARDEAELRVRIAVINSYIAPGIPVTVPAE